MFRNCQTCGISVHPLSWVKESLHDSTLTWWWMEWMDSWTLCSAYFALKFSQSMYSFSNLKSGWLRTVWSDLSYRSIDNYCVRLWRLDHVSVQFNKTTSNRITLWHWVSYSYVNKCPLQHPRWSTQRGHLSGAGGSRINQLPLFAYLAIQWDPYTYTRPCHTIQWDNNTRPGHTIQWEPYTWPYNGSLDTVVPISISP